MLHLTIIQLSHPSMKSTLHSGLKKLSNNIFFKKFFFTLLVPSKNMLILAIGANIVQLPYMVLPFSFQSNIVILISPPPSIKSTLQDSNLMFLAAIQGKKYIQIQTLVISFKISNNIDTIILSSCFEVFLAKV